MTAAWKELTEEQNGTGMFHCDALTDADGLAVMGYLNVARLIEVALAAADKADPLRAPVT